MSIVTALVAKLRTLDGLQERIGDRITPQQARQKSPYPRVTYLRVSRTPVNHLKGPSGEVGARIQLDVWAEDHATANDVAALLSRSFADGGLDGYSGTVGGYKVSRLWLSDEQDFFEPPQDGRDIGIYRVSQDWMIWFTRH